MARSFLGGKFAGGESTWWRGNWIPAPSLIASFMSAITILGVPAEIYIYNTQNWLIIASYVILFPSVALLFVPVFRAVDISSFYKVS